MTGFLLIIASRNKQTVNKTKALLAFKIQLISASAEVDNENFTE